MNNKNIKRNFIIGDEWLYYKIYTGVKTSDKILISSIKPLINQLINNNLIDSWFFIRYADPDFHLRIRFHCLNIDNLGKIIKYFLEYIDQFIESDVIWKVQVDTYKRELERYGEKNIFLSEQFFYCESLLLLETLSFFSGINGSQNKFYFVIKLIDLYIDCFMYDIQNKLDLFETLKESYNNEFNMNKNLKIQIDQKYRLFYKDIESALSSCKDKTDSNILTSIELHKIRITPIIDEINNKRVKGILDVNADHLLKSYIHMAFNRFFNSNQRFHELIIYNLLYRYYKSMIARMLTSK